MANVEEILRPLAERTVPCPQCNPHKMELTPSFDGWIAVSDDPDDGTMPCPTCTSKGKLRGTGKVLDPRFDALRARIDNGIFIETSLGAMVRAAKACEFDDFRIGPPNPTDPHQYWSGVVHDWKQDYDAWGETPEEAFALALIDAVEAMG